MKILEGNLEQFADDLTKCVVGAETVEIEDCDGYFVVDVKSSFCSFKMQSTCMELSDVDYYDFLFASVREIHERLINDLMEHVMEGFHDDFCDDDDCELHKEKVSH